MNSNKIIIASDSTSDLSADLIEKYSIKINPLYVVMNDIPYRDGIDVTPADIYKYHKETGKLATTTASNMGNHIDFFKQFTDNGCKVIYFSISSELSTSYNNACLAAEELENVYTIDSRNLSTGIGLQILYACELAEQGVDCEEIVKRVKEYSECVDSSFVIENLEFLAKGGRCSSVAALGANILKLRPCIEVKNGRLSVGKKFRGKMDDVLKEYVKSRLSNPDDIQTNRIFVTHTDMNPQLVDSVIAAVNETLHFDEVLHTSAGSTISVHCGPGTLGILFARKKPIS